MDITETLIVESSEEWRGWLEATTGQKREIWLVFYKKSTGKQTIDYGAAVEEAICFGWVDGQMKSMDEERYALRFTPRRPKSNWTEGNRELARRLISEGRMTAAGLEKLPQDFSRKPAADR